MPPHHFQNIVTYHWYVQELLRATKIRLIADQAAKGVFLEAFNRDEGEITIPQLVFVDGAFLQVVERVNVETGTPVRTRYSYHYERNKLLYFRYDKDPHPVRLKPLVHELCHLHVNAANPRYIAHETTFEQVFRFVMLQYYKVSLP